MLPIAHIPRAFCRRLQLFFTDIDDTLTSQGLLPADAYAALWELHDSGIWVIPVTGRPAGWCDHIARMWPVAGVVGENGAFSYLYDRKAKRMIRRYTLTREEREEGRRKLERIRERVLREVPGAAIAADQPYRVADLAVDFCEDVEPLSRADVHRICGIAEEEGATCRVSSIHVNCWYGDFSKITCVKRFTQDLTGGSFDALKGKALFIGDSPNDEPMFQEFETSVGVSNLQSFLSDIKHLPRYITAEKAAKGFREAVNVILDKRAS